MFSSIYKYMKIDVNLETVIDDTLIDKFICLLLGSSSGHGNELNQYSGVLPPVTLGNILYVK